MILRSRTKKIKEQSQPKQVLKSKESEPKIQETKPNKSEPKTKQTKPKKSKSKKKQLKVAEKMEIEVAQQKQIRASTIERQIQPEQNQQIQIIQLKPEIIQPKPEINKTNAELKKPEPEIKTTEGPKKKIKIRQKTHQQIARINRSKTQRMYLLEVRKTEEWNFRVLGFSGSVYNLTFNEWMSCQCIDFRTKKKPCKHIYFIMTQVAQCEQIINSMKNSLSLSQKNYTLLNEKLTERLKARLAPKEQKPEKAITQKQIKLGDDKDCAICFQELDQTQDLKNCGQCKKYFHSQCIKAWMTKNKTCPLCRFDLIFDDEKSISELEVQISSLGNNDPLGRLKKIKI